MSPVTLIQIFLPSGKFNFVAGKSETLTRRLIDCIISKRVDSDTAFRLPQPGEAKIRHTDPTMKEYALCKQEHPENPLFICFPRIKARTI